MKIFNRRRAALRSRANVFAASLLVALSLTLLPRAGTQWFEDAARAALAPGQRMAIAVGGWFTSMAARVQTFCAVRIEHQRALDEARSLRRENRRLQEALLLVGENSHDGKTKPRPEHLLSGRLIGARILGTQSRSFLEHHGVLDVGRPAGVEQDALVLDAATTLLNHGATDAVAAEQLVLAGGSVLGKIDQVGRWTSTLRAVCDARFRDTVQLVSRCEGTLCFGARGLLEGTGERLCRVRMVAAGEKVKVGDLVYTAPDELLPIPLVYGQVVRAERKHGATDWEIWMEPAADSSQVHIVHVLTAQLNKSRFASNGSAPGRAVR